MKAGLAQFYPYSVLLLFVQKLTRNEIEALPVLSAGLDLTGEQVEFDRLPVGL